MRIRGPAKRAGIGTFFERLEERKLLSLSYVEQPIPGQAFYEALFDDFDGDGDIDFASTANFQGVTEALRVHLNRGDGTFEPFSDYSIPVIGLRTTFATGDFNGDGHVDIVIGSTTDNAIFVPGIGDGNFGSASIVGAMWHAKALWTTDFSGDGIDDIVADAGGVIRLAKSNGDGTFSPSAVYAMGIQSASIIGLAQFDNDGVTDIGIYGSQTFQVWQGTNGGFTAGPQSLVDAEPGFGDFDSDGLADLAWAVWDQNSMRSIVRRAMNPGTGLFNSSTAIGSSEATASLIRPHFDDFDGDGDVDLGFTSSLPWDKRPILSFVMYAGDGAAQFDDVLRLFGLANSKFLWTTRVQFADTSGDGALDAFIFHNDNNQPPFLGRSMKSLISPPTIGSASGPSGPVTPGIFITISANNVTASPGRIISSVGIYKDNGNGTYDNNAAGVGPDLLVRNAMQASGSPDDWSSTSMVVDGEYLGLTRFFVVATDSEGASSEAQAVDIDYWTRIYFPEGWRNDDTTTEILSLLNESGPKANYRVIARYETGARDEIIAQGQLGWVSKAQITLVQRGNPTAALVRGHVGYAIEVQSDSFISASLLREENFGLPGEANRVTNVASLDSHAALRWGFADVSTKSHDFLVFYNPVERDVTLSIIFAHETLDSHVISYSLEPLRRGGLNLRDIAALAPNEDYSVEVVSTQPISAALSRYTESGAAGFTTIGQSQGTSKTFNGVGFGAGDVSNLVLFNPDSFEINISIRVEFEDPAATIYTELVSIAAGARSVLDLASLAPANASFADIDVTGDDAFYAQATYSNSTYWGNGQAPNPIAMAKKWEFADAFHRHGHDDEWLVITNTSASRMSGELRFVINGEAFVQGFGFVEASETIRINLSEQPILRDGVDLLSYGIHILSSDEFVVSLVHWDPLSGIGWQTPGTIKGTFTLL